MGTGGGVSGFHAASVHDTAYALVPRGVCERHHVSKLVESIGAVFFRGATGHGSNSAGIIFRLHDVCLDLWTLLLWCWRSGLLFLLPFLAL